MPLAEAILADLTKMLLTEILKIAKLTKILKILINKGLKFY